MNIELNTADPALVGNDALLAAVFTGSGDCIKILDLDGRLQFMSEGGKRVMEVDDFSTLKGCSWPDLWKDQGNLAALSAVDDARNGKPSRFAGTANTAKGTLKHWDVRVMPILGKDGKPTHLLSISTDVTEARVADETIRRLLDEARRTASAEIDNLRRLLRAAPSFMCILRGAEHRYELMNEAYMQLIGHRSVIGMTVRQALPELAGQGFYELLDKVFTTGETFVGRGLEIDLQASPGAPIQKAFLNFVYQPIREADGTITGIFVEGNDVTDQKKTELALRESEVRAKLALAAANMGVWQCRVINGAFSEFDGDDRAIRLLGGAPGDTDDAQTIVARIALEDRADCGDNASHTIGPDGDGILDIEFLITGRDGEADRWVHARAQALSSSVGQRLIGTVRDITDRKEAEARQIMLSGELQHRIKNTLAMVSAIASQTLKGDDIGARREAFSSRLEALATAHDLLTANTWQSAPIQSVIENALTPHMSAADRFVIDGVHLELTAKQALSMSLTIHELATNAAKYGAMSEPGGKVHISWEFGPGDDGERQFLFTWRESGGPIVTEPKSKGFGSRLIKSVLAADFDGKVRIDFAPDGVQCVLASRASSVESNRLALPPT
ncbi:MAG: PAS domain-containing protein [Microvirga sp.]|nr:PAS domain-containing protein [Microvirga sp.]